MPTIEAAIRMGSPVAVFARNHGDHLECAEKRAAAGKRTTFVVPGAWRAAEKACRAGLRPPIYVAVVGSGSAIQYVGTLEAVIIDDQTSPEALALLADRPGSDAGNDASEARTLYSVSGCRRAARKLDMTDLKKLSDGVVISPAFGYSYVLVEPVPGL